MAPYDGNPTTYTPAPPEAQTVLDLLALRELLGDPARWCKHTLCILDDGRKDGNPQSSRAVAWCVNGGLYKIAGFKWRGASTAIATATGWAFASGFNNNVDHPTLLAGIDKAIQIERSRATGAHR